MDTQYGTHARLFLSCFATHWPLFWHEARSKKYNQEARFRSYLRDHGVADADGGHLVTELPIESQTHKGRVDYALLGRPGGRSNTCLSAAVATCEFKGPARPTLWEYTKNWFGDAFVPDVQKQYERSQRHPEIEHYIACISSPPTSHKGSVALWDVHSSLSTLATKTASELMIPENAISSCAAHSFDEIDKEMVLFLWRIQALR